MKPYRGMFIMSAMLIAALPLSGCGNALDGGSSPSGSYITVSADTGNLEPDLYLTACTFDEDGFPVTYEPGITNTYATVTLFNDSAPSTPVGESTNNDVTMSRYRVDFTGLNKTVSLPSIDGAGLTVKVPKDGSSEMVLLIMDFATLEYLRSHYPTIGVTESLTLRATVTIWGEDPFDVTVETQVELTLVVDNYDRC